MLSERPFKVFSQEPTQQLLSQVTGSEHYLPRRETPEPCYQNAARPSERNRHEAPGPSLEFHDF